MLTIQPRRPNPLANLNDDKIRVSQPLTLGISLPLGKQKEKWQMGFCYTPGLFKHPLTEIDRMKIVGIFTI
ncbi:hypothetical protein CK516_03290 [Nostoc sp. 'Peltigera malacea cyanobiont' DB3992]|nr:hypothetical protein CK516_03290 [Nostoc sp. 'Peltigera malacea cyanobiont' DB3992]